MKAFQVQTGRAKAVTKPSLSLLPMQISQTYQEDKNKKGVNFEIHRE